MTVRERKAFVAVTAAVVLAMVVFTYGLALLGVDPELITAGLAVLVAVAAPISAYSFDRYAHPPEKH